MILRYSGSYTVKIEANKFSLELVGWNPPLLALTAPLDMNDTYRKVFIARGLDVDRVDDLALDISYKFDPDMLCIVLPRVVGSDSLDRYVDLSLSILNRVGKPLMILDAGSVSNRSIIEGIVERVGEYELMIGPADMDNYRTYTALASIYKQNLLARSTTDINQAKQLIQLIAETGIPIERIALDIASTGLGLGLEDTYNLVEQAKLLYGKGDHLLSVPIAAFTWDAWDSPEVYLDGLSISKGAVWEMITASAYILSSADIIILLDPEAFLYARRLIGMLSSAV
ncbi:MAG: hypothetical protein RMJ00_03365 [Nitrososphaerota archaeon]|nr:hypothetical protein [Candidatus Bathyarchaeota archaeon]MCX8162629.1 hypothetical protein [Candidatus Bathyarchaeota archaeon]MDW8061717.1 hypothetical protein [Nitrososphaerota archaeon]